MVTTWPLILGFAISASMDNLGVGISYGIRGIRIGLLANLMIAFICFLLSAAGILFGTWLAVFLPGMFSTVIGAFLLFIIGLRIVLLTSPRKKLFRHEESDQQANRTGVTGMLTNPEIFDADQSGEIGFGEAVLLGIALSANALTNGLGAGLLGFSPLAISITTAIGSFMTVWAGVVLGHKVAGVHVGSFSLGEFGTILSGIMLLIIALHTLL